MADPWDLPDITVVDARGSLAGWSARISAALPVGATLTVAPGPVTAAAGNPGEAAAAVVATVGSGQPVDVMTAAPGGGGGTFAVTAALHVALSGPVPVSIRAIRPKTANEPSA